LGSVKLEDPTLRQLVAMGDGLFARGEVTMAGDMYRIALKRAAPNQRQMIRTRLGLAAVHNNRSVKLLDLLQQLEALGWDNPFVSDGMATWFKTLPFAEDDRFQKLAEEHAALLPIANWHWNLQTVLWAVQRNRSIPGDYMELGVFKGHTTLFCSDYVEFQNWPKTWWLYDTFEGIPEDQQAPGWEEINKRTYTGTYSFDEVVDRFARIENIKVIKGRVPEILLEGAPEKIAFLHIDLNNAPAEIGALEVLFDRLSPGGIIIFDDYTWFTTRAQFDAEKQWFESRGLGILPLPTGQGVFVNP
jgi:hypothetical protein